MRKLLVVMAALLGGFVWGQEEEDKGGGGDLADVALQDLAERTGMPVATTLMGTGVLPPDHPQLIGMIGFWGSPTANRLASEAARQLAQLSSTAGC